MLWTKVMIMVEYHFAFGVTLFKVNNKQAIFFSTWVTGRKLCRCNRDNNNNNKLLFSISWH